jgi:uncharacterized membrane protein
MGFKGEIMKNYGQTISEIFIIFIIVQMFSCGYQSEIKSQLSELNSNIKKLSLELSSINNSLRFKEK